ncbi:MULTISPECIES: MFS transporter [unclassified Caballeronia]|jgi:sugar phosphate permease|uniref:MFS transporter n=1 Tax=unclassified Caballeronia TaxID=2646786 RepID=UPI003ECC7A28
MQIRDDGAKIGKTRWKRIGLLVFISYLIAFADRSNIGVAAPQMAHDLQLGTTITGALLSAFFWGYLVTQIPGGWLASRIGPSRVIAVAMTITGATACLTGLVHSLPALLAVRVVMGLAEGVIWPSFAVIFVRWFPARERARGIAFAQYALPLSSVVMAPLAGWMIDVFHWKTMFILQGIPAVAMALLIWFFVSDDPAKDRWISPAERDFIVQRRLAGVGADGTFSGVLLRPTVWLLSFAALCWIMVIFSFGLWMPSLIKQHFVSGFQAVGWLTALPPLFGAISMFLNSWLSDRPSTISRGWFVALPLIVSGVALLTQHYVDGGLPFSMVMFCIAGAGLYSPGGTWWAWVLSKVPRNQAAPSVALINVFASCGGVVGPLVVGFFARGGNLSNSFYILGYALFAAAAMVVYIIAKPNYQEYEASADTVVTH